MNENNLINIETKEPLTPEQIEAMKKRIAEQEEANELLNTKITPEAPVFRPYYAKDKLADQTAKILEFKPKEQTPAPGKHLEAGIELDDLIPEKDRPKKIEELMSGVSSGKVHPNDALEAMSKLEKAA